MRIEKFIFGLKGSITTTSLSRILFVTFLKNSGWYISSLVITDQSLQYCSSFSYASNPPPFPTEPPKSLLCSRP